MHRFTFESTGSHESCKAVFVTIFARSCCGLLCAYGWGEPPTIEKEGLKHARGIQEAMENVAILLLATKVASPIGSSSAVTVVIALWGNHQAMTAVIALWENNQETNSHDLEDRKSLRN